MIIDTPKGQVQIRELHSVAEMQSAEEIQIVDFTRLGGPAYILTQAVELHSRRFTSKG